MRGWGFRCGTLLACVLMLMLASCASAPMQPGPQASSLAVMADDQPFSLIFYRHPGTASGGGALPTAEVAVVLALAAGVVGMTAAVRADWVRPTRASVEPDARAADRMAAAKTVRTVRARVPVSGGRTGVAAGCGLAAPAGDGDVATGPAAMSSHDRWGASTDGVGQERILFRTGAGVVMGRDRGELFVKLVFAS